MARKLPNSDGRAPNCNNCQKLQLQCEKPIIDYRFLIHAVEAPAPPPDLASNDSCEIQPDAIAIESAGDSACLCIGEATELPQLAPRVALENPEIARFFLHYIRVIAPFYDLNDATNTFSTDVTTHSLEVPVLFRAIIALSSCHYFKVMGTSHDIAFAFYAACIKDLLEALHNSSNIPGDYLAAACLLQLYEILNESIESPPCHLLGAYSFLTVIDVDLKTWNLAQAGFWNYLREEISICIASNRLVRIGKDFTDLRDMLTGENVGDDMRANLVTYILARLVNLYHKFNEENAQGNTHRWTEEYNSTWTDLKIDLTLWSENLPSTFLPFSTAPKLGNIFPSKWMHKPWHVCALQYVATAKILLALSTPEPQNESCSSRLDLVQELTVEVCGLAFTNEDLAATINGFGPLLFCGRYLTRDDHRAALETMLVEFAKPTGYPMEYNVKNLKEWWAKSTAV